MSLNLSSHLQPLSVGPAPSGPSLYDIRNMNIGGSSSSGLSSMLNLGSGIASLAGSPVVGYGLNLLGTFLGNKSNSDMLKQQQDFAYKMWKLNNEYNTPSNQIKRLREAGVNPMLAMGDVGTGTSSSPADTPSASPVQPYTGGELLSNYNISKEANEIARTNAETQRMAVEADIPLKKREALKMDSEMDKLQAEILKIQAEEQKILSDEDFNKQKIEYQKVANEYYTLYGDDDYISRINSQNASAEFQRESKKWLGMHAKAARDSAKAALDNSSNMKQLYSNLAKESQQRIDNFNVQVDKWVQEGKLTKEQAEYMKKQNEHYEENQKLKWIQTALGAAKVIQDIDFSHSSDF